MLLQSILFTGDLLSIIVQTLLLLLVFFLTMSLLKRLTRDLHISVRDVSRKHNWCYTQLALKPCYCSVCDALLVSGEGVSCDCCGVCADPGCMKLADGSLKCKATTSSEDELMKHHWVKGNILHSANCDVCDEECGNEPSLRDWQCCWCHRIAHTQCKSKVPEVCDLGRFRHMIIPPNCVVVTKKRSSVYRKLKLRAVKSTGWLDWTPLFVLANRKSGSNDGDHVLSQFRNLLNPVQVIDLSDQPPDAALEWCSFIPEVKCIILVAGGDGTIGWVLNTINKWKPQCTPAVAILPLGTGNDLSRVLGWGKEHVAHPDLTIILEQLERAREVQLDRWNIEIRPCRHLGIRMPAQNMFMYNYMSVGVDAQVTLDFHRTRESPFYLFSNRIFNKLLYLGYGTQQAMERGCRDLEQRLELYLDNEKVDLPSIESVVILNIPSWGAGVHLWNMGDEDVPLQSFNDGKVEVVALYSSIHIAQLQMGLSQPHRVGQANEVRIKIKSATAIQVDGEPWLQHPACLLVTYHNQATVLTLSS